MNNQRELSTVEKKLKYTLLSRKVKYSLQSKTNIFF